MTTTIPPYGWTVPDSTTPLVTLGVETAFKTLATQIAATLSLASAGAFLPQQFKQAGDPDDTNSILAAVAAAAVNGGVLSFAGTYHISNAAPIVVPANVVPWAQPGALVIATTTGFKWDTHLHVLMGVPAVQRATHGWDTGADTTSIGHQFRNTLESLIFAPAVQLFNEGIEFIGDGAGNADNILLAGFIGNSKRNLVATITPGGYCNQIAVAGMFHHDSGFASYAGTREFDAPAVGGVAVADGWTFNAAELEGGLVERTVSLSGGEDFFPWCRWESATGVWLAATAIACAWKFGYALESLPFNDSTGGAFSKEAVGMTLNDAVSTGSKIPSLGSLGTSGRARIDYAGPAGSIFRALDTGNSLAGWQMLLADLSAIATPATPAANRGRLYFKAGTNPGTVGLYALGPDSVEKLILDNI